MANQVEEELVVRVTADVASMNKSMEATAKTAAESNEAIVASTTASTRSVEEGAAAVVTAHEQVAVATALSSKNIIQQGADLAVLDDIMKGTAKTAEAISEQEAVLDRLMVSGTITAEEQATALEVLTRREAELGLAVEYNTAATAENKVAQSALNKTLMSGNATREYSALVDEALSGRYRQMISTTAVLGGRLGLMKYLFSSTALEVMGLGAAIAVTVGAFISGKRESAAFNSALETTGGYIGITEDDFRSMASTVSDSIGSIGEAKQTLLEVARTGKFTGDQLQNIAIGAEEMARVTGESSKEVLKNFVDLSTRPLQSAVKLNDTYHFLTKSVIDQIAALQQEGKVDEAAAVAQQALADAFKARGEEMNAQMGFFVWLAQGAKDVFSEFWNEFKKIGTDTTVVDQIKHVNAEINALEKQTGLQGTPVYKQRMAALQAELAGLQAQQKQEESLAHTRADAAKKTAEYAHQVLDQQKQLRLHDSVHEEHFKLVTITSSKDHLNTLISDTQSATRTMEDTVRQGAVSMMEIRRAQMQEDVNLGRMTGEEELAQEKADINALYAAQLGAYEEEKQLYLDKPQQYAAMNAKILELERSHQLQLVQLANRASEQQKQDYLSMMDPIESAISGSVTGIVQGTQTWAGAERNFLHAVEAEFINTEAKKLEVFIANELTKRAAHTATAAVSVATAQASSISAKTASVSDALTSVSASAAKGGAATYANVAESMPYGWAYGAAIAAGVIAAILAMTGNIHSAAGGWDNVPSDQLAFIHKKEMVLSAPLAENVRQMSSDGGPRRGGSTNHFHISALDSRSFDEALRRNSGAVMGALMHSIRMGGHR